MTFEEKKNQFIRLFDKAALVASDWERQYGGQGILARIRRMAHMPAFYFSYLLVRFGYTPRPRKATTFWGYPLLLPGLGSDAFRLSRFGTLGHATEDKLTRFLIRTIQPADVFYDIGASYGFYTYLASEFITQGEIHAFEPLFDAFQILRCNTRKNSRCVLNNCVLSDKDGTDMFFQGYPSTVSSTMLEQVVQMNTWNSYHPREVVSVTLDFYLKNHIKPTIMKIDTEGAELLIIKGGMKFFSSNNPTVVMEVWGGNKGKQFSLPAVQELLELGYRPYAITSDGSLEKQKREDAGSFVQDSFDNLVFRR